MQTVPEAAPVAAPATLELALRRRFYAEELANLANLTSPALVDAFATVPRERFLRPGPWLVAGDASWASDPYVTPDADPRHLYHHCSVGIEPQFREFGEWQRESLTGATRARLVSYWRTQLRGLAMVDVSELPFARSDEGSLGRNAGVRLGAALTRRVAACGRQRGVTLYVLVLAALIAVLHAYTRRDSPGAGVRSSRHAFATRGIATTKSTSAASSSLSSAIGSSTRASCGSS